MVKLNVAFSSFNIIVFVRLSILLIFLTYVCKSRVMQQCLGALLLLLCFQMIQSLKQKVLKLEHQMREKETALK